MPKVDRTELLVRVIEAAASQGVREVVIGRDRCGFCGNAIGDVLDTELLHHSDSPKTVIRLNLCERCYRDCKRAGKGRLQ